ncbi:MAG TPA: hypothetical protein VGK16_11680 [Candidatus Limnocylindrales bacterium]
MTTTIAIVGGGAAVLMSAVAFVIVVAMGDAAGIPTAGFYGVATIFTGAGFGVVGLAIATRRRGHPMGWITIAIAVSQSAGSFASAYATFGLLVAPAPTPLADVASWLALWVWAPGLWLLVSLTYLFPEGVLRTGGQRGLAALAVAGTLLMTVPSAIVTWPHRGPLLLTDAASSEIPGGDLASTLQLVGVLLNLVVGLGGGAWLVRHYRSSTGIERQQRKWFVAAAIVFVALLWAAPFATIGPPLDAILGAIGGLVLPVAIAIAVLRYRLYEIDRIISRTIGWAVVTGVLVAVFASGVIVLQAALAPFTNENTLAVAASTLVAFALFQPVRRRVQRAVDRRFDRARYDGERVVASFAGRLRDQIDLGSLEAEIARVAHETVKPHTVAVWLRTVRGGDTPQVP